MHQIVLENVCKTFRVAKRQPGFWGAVKGAFVREHTDVKALDAVGFGIGEGELVGYIGPNGAGKSTTVKVMSGILVPDSGTCRIVGRIPWKERTAHVSGIGVVFGQRSQLWWDVPVLDSFELLRDIFGVKEPDYRNRLESLTGVLDIGALLKTPVRQLSLGQRMRCELAASLLHGPRILFLDEPTIGLDAVSKLALREFLKDMNARQGVTMILTTHDMDDIETLCDRVMVIGRGCILYDGRLQGLKRRYARTQRIRAQLTGVCAITDLPGAERVEINNGECVVHFDPEKTQAHRLVADLANACPIADIVVEEQDIDEIIAAMYREMKL